MVADTRALRFGNFGGADGESAIQLERIAVDDFAGELGGEAQGQRALPGSSRPYNRN
jgi:hypothetical protein